MTSPPVLRKKEINKCWITNKINLSKGPEAGHTSLQRSKKKTPKNQQSKKTPDKTKQINENKSNKTKKINHEQNHTNTHCKLTFIQD